MSVKKSVAIIGGGPAGLMAADILSAAGHAVTVYERKPTLGRKFLMAGRGGLNLTHSEPFEKFISRYGTAAEQLRPALEAFPPSALLAWSEGLGQPTFIGSSGRVFPVTFKTSPLLRALRLKLDAQGVKFLFQQEWQGWSEQGQLVFKNAHGTLETASPDATLLALGGGSWAKLGSDGGWVSLLEKQGVTIAPLRPSNCGFTVAWSEIFREKFAGQPLKPVALSFKNSTIQGEIMITAQGIEGGAVYALSPLLREEIAATGHAVLTLDLRAGVSAPELSKRLQTPLGTLSLSNFLRKVGGLSPVAIGLLHEKKIKDLSPEKLAALIKNYPLKLNMPFALDRAISSAGGVAFNAVNGYFMLKAKPNVFVAGEMLDWEAPTGGYLLQASFSTAHHAAQGILKTLGGSKNL
jgi:hypothetical protein